MPDLPHGGQLPVHGRSGPGQGPPPSVYLHSSVDLADKHVGCIEADGAREQPEGQDHEGRVAKVEERRNELDDVQLGYEHRREEWTLNASLPWPAGPSAPAFSLISWRNSGEGACSR